MTNSHMMSLLFQFPAYASKLSIMPSDISDPYGGTSDDYIKCLSDIEKALTAVSQLFY